jgi:hypothetical protein
MGNHTESAVFETPGTEPHTFICPYCRDERGLPRRVSIGAGVKTVSVECPACRHHWDERLRDAEALTWHAVRLA